MKTITRLCVATALFAAISFAPALAQNTTENSQFRQGFEAQLAPGSTLRLHLQAGDFRVIGTDSPKISIHAEGRNADLAKNMRIRLDRSGASVDLKLSRVPKNELQVTIEIPRSTNLFARMKGGDLSVQGVTGDKDLELTAGDLSVQVGNPADYSHIDLSVTFGDLSGDQFGDPKGWIGKSLRKDGTGKYRLHAHVMAGDLQLTS
jgi:hypothetical protein